jgi:competence protein ComFC
MNHREKIVRCGQKIYEFLIDTLFPPDKRVREIENMDTGVFIQKAQKSLADETSNEIMSLFLYKDPLVKTAILEVKSYGNKKVAKIIGKAVYDLLLEEISDLILFSHFTHPLIIPIPITRKSMRKRGWNQCELILNGIQEKQSELIFEVRKDILFKVRETGDQVGKGRKERFENLKNCFQVKNPTLVKERNIIVFDDILTTGATLLEAKRTLKQAGAKRVILVAFAH